MFDGPLSTPALHWIATTACFLLLGAAITIGVSKALIRMPLNAGVSPKILRTAKSCSLNRAQRGWVPGDVFAPQFISVASYKYT